MHLFDDNPFLWFAPWARILPSSAPGLLVSAGAKIYTLHPAEYFRRLLANLDGTRRVTEVLALGFEVACLQTLKDERLLIVLRSAVSANDPYSRELSAFAALDRIYPDTALSRLQNARIAILGVGGIGCRVSETLVRAGVRHLFLNDIDRVERTNLNRQTLFTPDDEGELKVAVARSRLQAISPDVRIEICSEDILGSIDWPFSTSADMTLLTADATPHHPRIPYAHTGAVTIAGYRAEWAEVGPTLSPERGTVCYECFRHLFVSEEYLSDEAKKPSNNSVNCSGSVINALASAMIAQEIILFLGFPDRPSPLLGKRRIMLMTNFEAEEVLVTSMCQHTCPPAISV
ncbi:ThiF family adenylyltransferase [Azospirillum argentinense]